MRAVAALSILLTACGGELTANDATDAANAHLLENLPQVQPAMNRLQIDTRAMGDAWRITYTAGPDGSGLVQIDVNKQTGQATITRFDQ